MQDLMKNYLLLSQVTEGRESLGSSANSHLSKALKSAITDRVVRVDHGDKPGRRPLYECEHCGSKLHRFRLS